MLNRNRLILMLIFALSILFLVLCSTPSFVNAHAVTVCRDPYWEQLRFNAYPVYETDTYDFSPKPQVGGQLNPGNILIADGVWTGKTGIKVNSTWYYVDWNTPYCDYSTDNSDGWRPGAPTILMEWSLITDDCAFVYIKNFTAGQWDGNWSQVVLQDGTPVLLHYGQNLIGGHYQSTQTEDYYLEGTICYE